jgi:Fe-S-cluster containining protein
MHDADATQAFLDSLPEVKPGESFRFACHPGVACFNACCGDLTLVLTPYDVYRLRKHLGLSSRDFIAAHAEAALAPDTGYPVFRLKMREDAAHKPCPFVTQRGCSVYPDRPGACRTYPIGRATKLDAAGEVVEQFFLVREDHCRGFAEDREWTPETWTADQGLRVYESMNDRLMRLLARQRELGVPLPQKKAGMVALALYQLDNFQKFVNDVHLLDRLELSEERKAGVLADEEKALDFALDWLGLALYGEAGGLRVKS